MSDKHTPEPWRIHRVDECGLVFVAVHANDGSGITIPVISYREETPEELARLRRIVACVNACVGIPTEQLEGAAISTMTGPLIVVKDKRT